MSRKLFALVQSAFAFMVLLGSTFEVINLLFPALFPALQENPLMAMHHTQRVVFWWTLCSNIATAILAALLLAAAPGIVKRSEDSSRSSIRALRFFALVMVGAAIVSMVYVIPQRGAGTTGIIVMVSVLSALFGLALTIALLWKGHSMILQRAR